MKKKNLPAIIMLSAGAIACITCIVNKYPILDTLLTVLITLVVFYIIGLIASNYIGKINKVANDAYVVAERERMKAEKEASSSKEETDTETEKDKETGTNSDSETSANEKKK